MSSSEISPDSVVSSTDRSKRSVKLDALRGIAILLVLGRHQRMVPEAGGKLYRAAALWVKMGWTGVDLFFVLSGFLVGGLLVKEILKFGDLHPSRFLLRRGFKIWPSYYVFLAWVAIDKLYFTTPAVGPGELWHNLWPSLANIQNYSRLIRDHLWSLGVEEHFYLLLPFLLLCFAATPELLSRTRVLVALLAIFALCLGMRIATPDVLPDFQNRYYTHLRLDSLAFGFLLTWIYHMRPSWWNALSRWRTLLFVGGLVFVSPPAVMQYQSRLLGTVGLSALYLGYGAILIACVAETSERPHWLDRILHGWIGKTLAFIGFSSYSIYLWHVDLARFSVRAIKLVMLSGPAELRWLAVTAVYVVSVAIGGILIGKMVEMPMLALRDRLFPARVSKQPVSVA